jgi:hypothetical protein
MALMEANQGVDPRTLRIGSELNLVEPGVGSVSGRTVAAYNASDAEYRADITDVSDDRFNIFAGAGMGLLSADARLLPEERVLFGQKRMSPYFGPKIDKQGRDTGRPEYLADRHYKDVAADLREGRLTTDQIPIEAFEYEGRTVSSNTRSLATLAEAGKLPTNVTLVTSSADVRARLGEQPIIADSTLPSAKVPVTEGGEVSAVVELPDTGKIKFVKGANAVGGGLAVVGAGVDGYSLGTEINRSMETGQWSNTAREAVRISGGWTGAWAGAKAGAGLGLLTGPAAWFWSPVLGLAGGVAGYTGGSWAATSIYDSKPDVSNASLWTGAP